MLLLRLGTGLIFTYAGWYKIANISQVIAGFTDMFGAMGPFLAYLVSYTELIAGVMLILGLWASYASLPLIIIMLVVLFYVKVKALLAFAIPDVQLDLLLLVSLAAIVLGGSGKFALKPSGCPCCGDGTCPVTPESSTKKEPEAKVVYPNEGK